LSATGLATARPAKATEVAMMEYFIVRKSWIDVC